VVGWTGVGTQLNGIGHIGIDNVYYNGNRAADFVTVEGWRNSASKKCRRSSPAAWCWT
jgi:hypothetical protein